ncbi:Y-family DNA polymerase [Mycoplasmopsis glycophila]|uniref:DNA polymerase IV n=1 Tax=Mycoplasmopsis glycophila TaxID=171285 RepID=A0A449AUP9_9BACT|nr:DNA polymerase IV [Mycoplasmopsis glycophila]VEU70218.1 DNA polymerase IV [Mycoplasmopsis glycophila]
MSVILHIDFDSYFVNAIKTIKPNLKNRPMVCARTTTNAIALSMTYDIKKFGFKAGALVSEIRKKVPNLVVVQPIYSLFSTLSSNIFAYFYNKISKRIDIASIDECYIDITDKIESLDKALEYAKKIQQEVLEKFKIPISIGVSYNKFFAKMTTNLIKPFNVGLTDQNNYQENFWNLPIESFHGIGRRTAPKLKELGILTIGDLAQYKDKTSFLKDVFGKNAKEIIECLNPTKQERIPFAQKEDPKGIGKEISFDSNENILDDHEEILRSITYELIEKLEIKKLVCKTITVIARDKNKKWISKQMKLSLFTQKEEEILPSVIKIYRENFANKEWKGLGVRLTDLQDAHQTYQPVNLFNNQVKTELDIPKNSSVSHLILKINSKIGSKNAMTLKQYQEKQKKEKEDNFFESSGGIFKK